MANVVRGRISQVEGVPYLSLASVCVVPFALITMAATDQRCLKQLDYLLVFVFLSATVTAIVPREPCFDWKRLHMIDVAAVQAGVLLMMALYRRHTEEKKVGFSEPHDLEGGPGGLLTDAAEMSLRVGARPLAKRGAVLAAAVVALYLFQNRLNP